MVPDQVMALGLLSSIELAKLVSRKGPGIS